MVPHDASRRTDVLSNIAYRHLIDLMAVGILTNQPAQSHPGMTAPCLRSRASANASSRAGSIAWQVNSFVVIQNVFAVSEVKVVTRHWLLYWATQLGLRAQVLGDVSNDVLDRPDATAFTIARRVAALIDDGA